MIALSSANIESLNWIQIENWFLECQFILSRDGQHLAPVRYFQIIAKFVRFPCLLFVFFFLNSEELIKKNQKLGLVAKIRLTRLKYVKDHSKN